MKFAIISIINFKKILAACQSAAPGSQTCEGFLLIELVYALVLSLMLYGVGVYWKHGIITTQQESITRLQALNTAHEVLERMISDHIFVKKGRYAEQQNIVAWDLERVIVDEIRQQLPPVLQPSSFRLVKLKVTWPGNNTKRSAELISGIILDE